MWWWMEFGGKESERLKNVWPGLGCGFIWLWKDCWGFGASLGQPEQGSRLHLHRSVNCGSAVTAEAESVLGGFGRLLDEEIQAGQRQLLPWRTLNKGISVVHAWEMTVFAVSTVSEPAQSNCAMEALKTAQTAPFQFKLERHQWIMKKISFFYVKTPFHRVSLPLANFTSPAFFSPNSFLPLAQQAYKFISRGLCSPSIAHCNDTRLRPCTCRFSSQSPLKRHLWRPLPLRPHHIWNSNTD